jgi:endogenous inhibitor of DNA gyrase (YacG/DUF329 family)
LNDAPNEAMTCPICNRESDPKYRPFCSRRCADVDLGRWLTGGYAIPAAEEDDPDNEAPAPPPPRPH